MKIKMSIKNIKVRIFIFFSWKPNLYQYQEFYVGNIKSIKDKKKQKTPKETEKSICLISWLLVVFKFSNTIWSKTRWKIKSTYWIYSSRIIKKINKETILWYRIIIILKVLMQNIIPWTKVCHIYRNMCRNYFFYWFY